jgi:hypothetical protein
MGAASPDLPPLSTAAAQAEAARAKPAPRAGAVRRLRDRILRTPRRPYRTSLRLPGLSRPEKPEPKRDTNADRQAQWDEWNEWADSKIENAFQAERAFVLECVGQAVGQMIDDERQAYKRALQSEAQGLKTELAELKALLVEYRAFFATGDRSVLDLPNPLAAKRVN